jgi:hypothetical protein
MSIEIISRIVPKNGQSFAVLEDKYLHGGFQVVATLTSVPMDSRKEGMIVYAEDVEKYYKLYGGLDDVNWAEISLDPPDTYTHVYQGTIASSSDGYLTSLDPFLSETNDVYSVEIAVTIASTSTDLAANFVYKMLCRDQSGAIVIDSTNEIASYDALSQFTVNFVTTGIDQELSIQLVNGSVEEVAAKATLKIENVVSRG